MRNKLTGMMMLSVAALGIIGCADKLNEDAVVDKITGDGSYVYMDVAIALPSASNTRSTTDTDDDGEEGDNTNSNENPDHEFGYAYENDVRSMLLVLADAVNDNYITHAVVSGITQWPDNDPLESRFNFSMTQKFSRQEIEAAYADQNLLGGTNKDVNVYAFCNYTADLFNKFKEYAEANDGKGQHDNKWLDWTGEVVESGTEPGVSPIIQNSIWSNRSFLMSNSSVRKAAFPDTPEAWDEYTQESKPFSLTKDKPVYVERTAARFDYKDGSEYVGTTNKDELYRYDLKVKTGQKVEGSTAEEELNLISVQLTRMALVNMSKEYYYLRRVSDNGTGEAVDASGNKNDDVEVGGEEKQTYPIGDNGYDTNYVIDTDWSDKNVEYGINTSNASDHFNFPLFKTTSLEDAKDSDKKKQYNLSNWYADNIADILKEGNNLPDTWKDQSYKIWRYVTENTIPAPIENQKTVQSVGIVFKAAIVPGKHISTEMEMADNSSETGKTSYRYISEEVENALKAAQLHRPQAGSKEAEGKSDDEVYDYPTLYFYHDILYAGIKDLGTNAVAGGRQGYVYGLLDDIFSNWVLVNKTFKHVSQIENYSEQENDVRLTVEIWDEIEGRKVENPEMEDHYLTGYTIDLDESADYFKKLFTDRKVTIYEASNEDMGKGSQGWGYYCYYFYWNRHNSNNNASIMVPMEFATVRNNVYKLSVTKIGELGHPNIPANDPDPVDPEDPDEEDKVYMEVKVEVLPWVVRVNDIEF